MKHRLTGLTFSVGQLVAVVLTCSSCAYADQKKLDFFPLGAGREWTYQLVFPEASPLHFDPYFVNDPGITSSSVTHGTTRAARPAGSTTITIRTIESAGPAAAKIDLNDEGRRLWFNNEITSTRLVVSKSTDSLPENHPWRGLLPFPTTMLVLELHGVTTMGKEDPWVLGHLLAIVPADGKSKVEKNGWVVQAATAAVIVPAGSFARSIHSRIPKGAAPLTPFQAPTRPEPHTLESWVAEGVGLIRSTITLGNGRSLYRLELVDYKPR